MMVDGKIDELLLTVLLCIKSIDWREEHEWRLLLLADAEQSIESRIIPFERSSISRVFLGPRIEPAAAASIEEAAGLHDPPIPVFTREIDATEAKEELMGFERIHSLEQLNYWLERCDPDVKTTPAADSGRAEREAQVIERAARAFTSDNKS